MISREYELQPMLEAVAQLQDIAQKAERLSKSIPGRSLLVSNARIAAKNFERNYRYLSTAYYPTQEAQQRGERMRALQVRTGQKRVQTLFVTLHSLVAWFLNKSVKIESCDITQAPHLQEHQGIAPPVGMKSKTDPRNLDLSAWHRHTLNKERLAA